MRLKSYGTFPPHGFSYLQPETGFRTDSGLTWIQTLQAVQKHRSKNPRFNLSLDINQIAVDVEQQICARLAATPGAASYIIQDSSPFHQAPLQAGPLTSAQSLPGVAAIKNAVAGVGALLDWLGDGMMPVGQELADKRGGTCAGCPKNAGGDLLQKLEAAAASVLRQQIEIRKDMKLRTQFDSRLRTCLACDCWTQLKVWVPFAHIEAHTRPEIWKQLHPTCWMLTERPLKFHEVNGKMEPWNPHDDATSIPNPEWVDSPKDPNDL